jgi:transcriptional regulator with XRE-family HTH domain
MNTKFKQTVNSSGITLTDLAKILGVSRVHLTNIANGEPAGKKLAEKIFKWSKGQIVHTDVLYPQSLNTEQ